MDIFKLYKTARQRSRRHPEVAELEEMEKLTQEMSKGLLNETLKKEELRSMALEYAELEKDCRYGFRDNMHPHLIRSIDQDSYTNDVPYQVQHEWRERATSTGFIYVATALTKRGLSKLGATTLTIERRFEKYNSKYGYQITPYWYTRVYRPFYVEKSISDSIGNIRKYGMTMGDSIEWFSIKPSDLQIKISHFIESEKLEWHPASA